MLLVFARNLPYRIGFQSVSVLQALMVYPLCITLIHSQDGLSALNPYRRKFIWFYLSKSIQIESELIEFLDCTLGIYMDSGAATYHFTTTSTVRSYARRHRKVSHFHTYTARTSPLSSIDRLASHKLGRGRVVDIGQVFVSSSSLLQPVDPLLSPENFFHRQ